MGLDRFEARVEAVEKLRELGILVKEEPYENNVGFSERADVPIEPRLSEQWFLRYPKTAEARAVVREGLIRFFPNRWEKVYDYWLENIRTGAFAQFWWGHRIGWYRQEAKAGCRCPPFAARSNRGRGLDKDPDVLDTWFSCGLGHETMDEETRKKFYPTVSW